MESDPNSEYGGQLVISFPESSSLPSFSIPLCPTEALLKTWQHVSDVAIWKNVTDAYVCESFDKSGPSPSELLSKYIGRPVVLVLKGPGSRPIRKTESHPTLEGTAAFQDGYPLLLASTESLEGVQNCIRAAANGEGQFQVSGIDPKWKDEDVIMERFRPNIVVSGLLKPFDEDSWGDVAIGDPVSGGGKFTFVSRCGRCRLPNVDPNSGEYDESVPFKVIAKFRRVDKTMPYTPCFGVNGLPQQSGVLRVGDNMKVLTTFDRNNLPPLLKK